MSNICFTDKNSYIVIYNNINNFIYHIMDENNINKILINKNNKLNIFTYLIYHIITFISFNFLKIKRKIKSQYYSIEKNICKSINKYYNKKIKIIKNEQIIKKNNDYKNCKLARFYIFKNFNERWMICQIPKGVTYEVNSSD